LRVFCRLLSNRRKLDFYLWNNDCAAYYFFIFKKKPGLEFSVSLRRKVLVSVTIYDWLATLTCSPRMYIIRLP